MTATKKKSANPSANGLRMEVVRITPEIAEDWLGKNLHNRKLSASQVERLAQAIMRDEFEFNGEPIQFDKKDRLLNGQHRLAAVVQAQRSIDSVVIHGLPSSVQETMDTGVRRNLSHVLELRGEGSAGHLSSVLRHIWKYENRSLPSARNYPTNKEALGLLERDPEIRESLRKGWTLSPHIPGLSQTQTAALYHICSRIEEEDAEFFFDRLADYQGLVEGDPIYVLRKTLERLSLQPRRPTNAHVFAITLKAWNAYRKGEKISILTWRPGGKNPEQMPVAE